MKINKELFLILGLLFLAATYSITCGNVDSFLSNSSIQTSEANFGRISCYYVSHHIDEPVRQAYSMDATTTTTSSIGTIVNSINSTTTTTL